jgi:hypothetical protein
MLIYPCCRLRAVAAIRAVEIEGDNAMLAESAFECGAAICRCGCVVSHNFIVVPLPVRALGNRCATFLQETVWRHRYSSLLLIYHLSSGSRHNSRETKNVGCLQSQWRAARRSTLSPINYYIRVRACCIRNTCVWWMRTRPYGSSAGESGLQSGRIVKRCETKGNRR